MVGSPATWPEHIRARYGVRERPRWLPALLLLIGAAAAALATLMAFQLSDPAVAAGVTGYSTLADDHMQIEFQLQRRDASPATCVLRARAEDGFDVGYAVVELPDGQGRTNHIYQLRTAYRALVGEMLGCGVDGPPPDVPAAAFRPGVVPPEQPWTPTGP
jgi:hypothetical protein